MSKKPAKKPIRKSAKKAAKKKTAKAAAHRAGTIREKLEELYKKHGYVDAKKEAIKKGFNKHTTQTQLYLIHSGK